MNYYEQVESLIKNNEITMKLIRKYVPYKIIVKPY